MYVPEILQNRSYLITVIGTWSIFRWRNFDYQMAAHEILHVAAITFGIFLIIVSLFAYSSTKNTNMIFTALAFLIFTLLSIYLLEEDLTADRLEHDEAAVVDVLLTVMIGLFAIGVFSNQRFSNRTKYN